MFFAFEGGDKGSSSCNAGQPRLPGLEESFVVLGSASILRPPGGGGAGSQVAPPLLLQQSPNQPQQDSTASGLDAKLQALAQLFELASTSTHVDHPLCLDCAAQLKDEIEAQVGLGMLCTHAWLHNTTACSYARVQWSLQRNSH